MMDLDNIPDTQTEAEELEEVVMGLIINSGQARSLAYAALKQAKQGDFAAAKAIPPGDVASERQVTRLRVKESR